MFYLNKAILTHFFVMVFYSFTLNNIYSITVPNNFSCKQLIRSSNFI